MQEFQELLAAMPLPPNEAGLKTIKADLWLKVAPDDVALEGPAFDREGNLFFTCVGKGQIYKVKAGTKELSIVYDDNGASHFSCIDIHKDGRFFLADIYNGKIVAMNPDGTGKTDIVTDLPFVDDIIFDKNGNFYATQLYGGGYKDQRGKVIFVTAESNYKDIKVVYDNMQANGVALSPDEKYLYTTEYGSNILIRGDLGPDGMPKHMYGSQAIYRFTGPIGPDSTAVDSAGNVLQPIAYQGRLIIFDKNGFPLQNVLLEDRGNFMKCTNVCLKPGTNEAYAVSAGTGGSAVFTFPALANAITMYSHR